MFYKIFKEIKPVYFFNPIPTKKIKLLATSEIQIKLLYFVLNITFSKVLFPCTVFEWNKLDPNPRGAGNLNVFKKNLLNFIRPSPTVDLTVTIADESNTSQNYALV